MCSSFILLKWLYHFSRFSVISTGLLSSFAKLFWSLIFTTLHLCLSLSLSPSAATVCDTFVYLLRLRPLLVT